MVLFFKIGIVLRIIPNTEFVKEEDFIRVEQKMNERNVCGVNRRKI